MKHYRTAARPAPCSCDECARLDLAFPGEGLQLAIPLPKQPRPKSAGKWRRLADIEAEAFGKVPFP